MRNVSKHLREKMIHETILKIGGCQRNIGTVINLIIFPIMPTNVAGEGGAITSSIR